MVPRRLEAIELAIRIKLKDVLSRSPARRRAEASLDVLEPLIRIHKQLEKQGLRELLAHVFSKIQELSESVLGYTMMAARQDKS